MEQFAGLKRLILLIIGCLAFLGTSCGPISSGYYPQPPYDYDENYWNDWGDEDDEDFGDGTFSQQPFFPLPWV